MCIPTPHNNAKKGDIAKKVLMPGDPLRAKYIAETYLENPVCFNTVRNVLGYTGTYKGQEVSVMASGMGMPSIGIYSYELYNFYDVDKIIRIGSAGALQDDVNVMDVIIAMGACTDSNYGSQYNLPGVFAPTASYELVARAVEVAREQGTPVRVGNVVSSDAFYNDNPAASDAWKKMGVLCAEMECAGLYFNAARAGKQALGILTISDHIYREEAISAEARQTSFNKMMEIALGI
ncbi:MAG: purine-nucleoside phosphorylase [Clostridia bacterium]|nr:purine-nucleoside phosphorylase [Clostridia bacterium]MDY5555004.1 purine-nucleoside phosphorylase [Blautia sp.]